MSPAWKSSFDSKIFFAPMFDETDGYYASGSGVSLARLTSSLDAWTDDDVVVVLLGRPSGRSLQLGGCVAASGRRGYFRRWQHVS